MEKLQWLDRTSAIHGSVHEARILVLESNARMQRNVGDGLRSEGFEPLLPGSMAEAFQIFREGMIEMAIVSAELPQDGLFAVLKALRNSVRSMGTGIIATLSHPNPALATQLLTYDVSHVLSRPIEIGKMVEAVADLAVPMPQKGNQVMIKVPEAGEPLTGHVLYQKGDKVALALAHELPMAASYELQFIAVDHSMVTYEVELEEGRDGHSVHFLRLVERVQRRRYFRRPLAIPVRYRLPGQHARLAVSRDLSLGGMRLGGIQHEVAVGDRVEILIAPAPGRLIGPFQATIQRLTAEREWGLAFDEVEEATQDELLEIIFGDARSWGLREA